MNKRIIGIAALSFIFSGTVSASSINGQFKGNPIVSIKSNGVELNAEDTPAVIYEGRTMVPIYMLRYLGAQVTWNESEYSVDISLPAPNSDDKNIDVITLGKKLKQYGVEYVQTTSNGSDFLNLTYLINKNWYEVSNDKELFPLLLKESTNTTSTYTSIDTKDNHHFGVPTSTLKLFFSGKINADELSNNFYLDNKPMTQKSTSQTQQKPVSTSTLSLYSNDGKVFLGKLSSNEFDLDSIYNEFGNYGSKFSLTSIFNQFGDYGSEFSLKSAFNKFTTTPPIIVDKDGKVIGYLTTNSTLNGAVSPIGLKEWLKNNGY